MNKLIMITAVMACTLTLAGCGVTPDAAPTDTPTNTDSGAVQDVVTSSGEVKPTKSWDTTAVDPTAYTMDQITAANTEANCLTVIDGKVYDLTAWINQHPGGDRNILRICGIDGTSAFQGKHGGQDKPETTLEGFQIGILTQ